MSRNHCANRRWTWCSAPATIHFSQATAPGFEDSHPAISGYPPPGLPAVGCRHRRTGDRILDCSTGIPTGPPAAKGRQSGVLPRWIGRPILATALVRSLHRLRRPDSPLASCASIHPCAAPAARTAPKPRILRQTWRPSSVGYPSCVPPSLDRDSKVRRKSASLRTRCYLNWLPGSPGSARGSGANHPDSD